jgi:hypothetical protein
MTRTPGATTVTPVFTPPWAGIAPGGIAGAHTEILRALGLGLTSTFVGESVAFPVPGRFADEVRTREEIVTRLRSLAELRDGWDGPNSRAPLEAPVCSYLELVESLGLDVRSEIEPMASPDGGLRIEWDRGSCTYIAELQGDGRMYLCVLGDIDSDDHDATFASVDMPALVRFIQDGTIVS